MALCDGNSDSELFWGAMMSEDNKRNILFFKAGTMSSLFEEMDAWQVKNKKRFLTITIEREGDGLCCIALTNPSEVTIVDDRGTNIFKGLPTMNTMYGQKPVPIIVA
jgi:hypothetical protein